MASSKKPKRKHAHLHRWAQVNRADAANNMRLQLGATYDLLDASADFGLELLQQCYVMRMKTRPSTTSWVSLLILHRTLELLEGISVLVVPDACGRRGHCSAAC